MKFILDGGWEKDNIESENNSVIVRFKDFILDSLEEGKKVLIVTNAKPTGSYDDRIRFFLNNGAESIDRNTREVEWSKYDIVLVLGGDTGILFKELIRLGFEIKKLKESLVYIGSSAGTQVMGNYFYDYDRENKKVDFPKGFIPEGKLIYLVHDNNFFYSDDFLREKVKMFALENNLIIVPINENEVIEK